MRSSMGTTILAMALLLACGPPAGTATEGKRADSKSPSAASQAELDDPKLERTFDVGDHKLYLRCTGTGSPTIVYLHGYIFDPKGGDSSNAGDVPALLDDDNRVCIYDRANVGRSGEDPGPLTGQSSIEDLHALLRSAKVEEPYVLVGGSFGGLLAYMYAATYPHDVVGMLLLDASLPNDISDSAWESTTEQINQEATHRQARRLLRREPDIPLTYIGLKDPRVDYASSAEEVREIKAQRIKDQREFVARFPSGRLLLLDVPHYMEPVIPERIADEITRVLEAVEG